MGDDRTLKRDYPYVIGEHLVGKIKFTLGYVGKM